MNIIFNPKPYKGKPYTRDINIYILINIQYLDLDTMQFQITFQNAKINVFLLSNYSQKTL